MTELVTRFDALLFDLDGVVYVGPDPVQHAAAAIAAARASGVACGFVTNNASRTPQAVADHLSEIGVPAGSADVITSPQAAVSLLSEHVPPGARILVIGGAGIADELTRGGYSPVRSLADDPAAVMQGFSPDLTWRDLAEATYAVRAGLPWVATNMDLTFPTPGGPAPGNGSLVRLVSVAAGREPDAVAGKPEPPLLTEAIARLDSTRPLMIGDRLDTDIEAGARVGIPSLLVLTGVSTVGELLTAAPEQRPAFIGADLRVLQESYPSVECPVSSSRARCGEAVVQIEDGSLAVTTPGQGMDAVRAAAALCWAHADRARIIDIVDALPRLEQAVTAAQSGSGPVR